MQQHWRTVGWCLSVLSLLACVPNAPSAVTAKAGDRTATVSWTAPEPRLLGAVTRSTVRGDPGGLSLTVGAAGTQATFANLTDGVSYRFTVTATNWRGDGPSSAPSPPVIPAGPPGAPTDVESGVKDQGAHIISLSWTPPTDNGGSGVTEYAVTATPDPNDAFGPADGGSLSVSTRQTEVDVPGLAADVNYTFTVRALNAAGAGPESKATDPQKVPCVFAPDVGPDAGPSTPQPDNESENDSDEEGAALVAMRPVVRASCLRCPGPPVACEVGHTVFGEWGSGNATLTFSHAGGCRYDGEFSQVDGEGNTPGFVSEKISFGAPVGEKAVQELLRKCSCDVETVDKDEGGRPAAYHCKAESDGVMDFTDTYTLTRDSGQRITSLTRKL